MDCDGVIFDANPVKVRAFEAAVADAPAELRAALVEHHRQSGGVSRYVKLRRFYEQMYPVDDPEAALAAALERFSVAAVEGYRDLSPRPEALRFAERLGGSVVVVSGSDETELRQIFSDKGILDRFAEVLGSPTPKVEHMRRVLEERGLTSSEALMVGDGRGDLEASHALGIPFIYLEEMSPWTSARKHLRPDDTVASTWTELLARCD